MIAIPIMNYSFNAQPDNIFIMLVFTLFRF